MSRSAARRLVLSAGEPSGDLLAAHLATHLKALDPNLQLAGITGPAMRAAGVESWFDIDQLSVMGLSEIIGQLPRILTLRRWFRQRIVDWAPQAFIGIDAPEFNLGLARQLKTHGLTTLQYVSPSVWAWRPGRVSGIARSIDHLLALFPFEPSCYANTDLKVSVVGHPLADSLTTSLGSLAAQAQARQQLNLPDHHTIVALLPGSRDGELKRHLPLLEAITRQHTADRQQPIHYLLLLADASHQPGTMADLSHVTVLTGQTPLGLQAADAALCASGTVTLEAFLLGCPQVVFYRLAASTHWLAKTFSLLSTTHVALPNILTASPLVPELIQHQATPATLIGELDGWLGDPQRVAAYRDHAQHWQQALRAGDRAAQAVLATLP
jgi:lipid-A-disaccharide synthase